MGRKISASLFGANFADSPPESAVCKDVNAVSRV
jgi:hypothetical protein